MDGGGGKELDPRHVWELKPAGLAYGLKPGGQRKQQKQGCAWSLASEHLGEMSSVGMMEQIWGENSWFGSRYVGL